ncbi:YSIRK family gram-positive signal peptide, partial [Elysia marginata]
APASPLQPSTPAASASPLQPSTPAAPASPLQPSTPAAPASPLQPSTPAAQSSATLCSTNMPPAPVGSSTEPPTAALPSELTPSKETLMKRLLLMVRGWDEHTFFDMMRRRQECVGVEGQEPEYQEFIYLWSQVVSAPSFENLPLPQ